jgi:hypothetical protein
MNIGFYLLDVDSSSYHRQILKAINDLCQLRPVDNIVLFNNQFNTIDLEQKYYILHINQAKFFKGPLFVFGTKASMLTNTFPCPTKQILYMQTPEWSEHPELPFTAWSNIYLNDNTYLLTDNIDTHNLIKICWKEPLPLINSINAEALNNVLQAL